MIAVRTALWIASFLGAMYALLSLMSAAFGDFTAGTIIAAAGLAGWLICDWIEEYR